MIGYRCSFDNPKHDYQYMGWPHVACVSWSDVTSRPGATYRQETRADMIEWCRNSFKQEDWAYDPTRITFTKFFFKEPSAMMLFKLRFG